MKVYTQAVAPYGVRLPLCRAGGLALGRFPEIPLEICVVMEK